MINAASSLSVGLWQWMQPRVSGVGEFVFFKLISDYLDHKITALSEGMMSRAMEAVSLVAVGLLTAWILIVGYQVMNGTFRGSMSALVTEATRRAVIVTVAASMTLLGEDVNYFFTEHLDKAVNYVVNGEGGRTTTNAIDENLAYTQVAFTAIDAVNVSDGNPQLQAEKERALMFAGFGTSSPALTAGAMLIFFKFTLGIFIGLGPIFILTLLFDATKQMFQRWLQYGIATIFAMAGLNAVSAIVLDLSTRIAVAFWGAKGINGLIGANPEGLTTQAMQQGWIGLLLTVAIISVPSMLAAFFGGLAGSFSAFSQFQTSGGGAPPGARGAGSPPLAPSVDASPPRVGEQNHSRIGGSQAPPVDVVKQRSDP